MSNQMKWAVIYLCFSIIPFFLYFFPPSNSTLLSHGPLTDFLVFVPYIGFTLIAVLGWQINQTRIFWASLFLLSIFLLLLGPAPLFNRPDLQIRFLEILSAGYPLALCVLFLMKESKLLSDQSLARFLLAVFPFVIFLCMASWAPEAYRGLFYWGHLSPDGRLKIPHLAWLTTAFFLICAYILPDLKIKGFLWALAITLIPLFTAIQTRIVAALFPAQNPGSFQVTVCFSVIAAILLHAVLHTYWQKVYQDPLTGIPNRQAMDERLHTLGGEYAIAMVDIDHFKKFNDTYGHAEGDNVLRMVALHLQEHLGQQVYRYGGEEFCAIFEKPLEGEAFEKMDKTRSSLAARKFTLRFNRKRRSSVKKPGDNKEMPGKEVRINISVGIAAAEKNTQSSEEVIKRADKALYQAKEKGRNQVVDEGKSLKRTISPKKSTGFPKWLILAQSLLFAQSYQVTTDFQQYNTFQFFRNSKLPIKLPANIKK